MRSIRIITLFINLLITDVCFSQIHSRFIESSPGIFTLKIKPNTTMIVTRSGGRILSFRIGETEIITQEDEHENFGSTLWTSPQSDWGWPPFKVLDQLDYEGGISGDSLWLKSGKDTLSGFQMEKIIKPEPSKQCVSITYVIRNISDTKKKVAAWEVTRVPAGGLSFFLKGDPAPVPVSNLEGVSEMGGAIWFKCSKKLFGGGQKLFSIAKEGWLAHVHQNLIFIKTFPSIKPIRLAPKQGEVELYANGERIYVELENHGAYQELLPGESLKYHVSWYLQKLPKTLHPEIGSIDLLNEVENTIR